MCFVRLNQVSSDSLYLMENISMKTEEIQQLFAQFESVASNIQGIECWSAGDVLNTEQMGAFYNQDNNDPWDDASTKPTDWSYQLTPLNLNQANPSLLDRVLKNHYFSVVDPKQIDTYNKVLGSKLSPVPLNYRNPGNTWDEVPNIDPNTGETVPGVHKVPFTVMQLN